MEKSGNSIWKYREKPTLILLNSNFATLWPDGLPTAFAVKNLLLGTKRAVIRGYQTGAISFGLENAAGTAYQRLQINPDGSVVYYYYPEGATQQKHVILVSPSQLS